MKKKKSKFVKNLKQLFNFKRKTSAQKISILIILVATLAVVIAIFAVFIFSPENTVKNKFARMASAYYEEHFYPNIYSKSKSVAATLEPYSESGFARVTMRQILLSDTGDGSYVDLIRKYCDENTSYVQFFPESPYLKNSYRAEYTYSCSF